MKITLFFVAKETMVRCLSFANCAGLNDGRLEEAAVNIKEYSNQKLVKPFFEKPFLTVLK